MNEFLREEEAQERKAAPSTPSVSRAEVKKEEPPTMAQKWAAASKKWAKETNLTYLSNPASRRDFRVQFRSGKSGWLIGIYLFALSVATIYEYAKISFSAPDLADAQGQLLQFFQVIMIGLGGVIALVAPALAATSIVVERQKQSLDLVFVTPVPPRVYLIGKLVSSFRFLWTLLALSAPFTAICVVMGGATWMDVLGGYFLLSLQGLFFSAIGLLFSSRVEKPVSAVIYTYCTVIAYCYGAGMLGWAGLSVVEPGNPLSLIAALNPFTLFAAMSSFTNIFGVGVPNVILAAGVLLGMVNLCLTAAGSVLAPIKPKQRRALRLAGVGTLAAVTTYVTLLYGSNHVYNFIGVAGCFALAPLAIFVPYLTCYGKDGERRSTPEGLFNIRETFTGKPSGALPFIWLTVGVCQVAAAATGFLLGNHDLGGFGAVAVYDFGLWTFAWSLGRVSSSFLYGLRSSQILQMLIVGGVCALPVPIFSFFAPPSGDRAMFMFPWTTWILDPIFTNGPMALLVVWGVLLLAISWIAAVWSEGNRKRRENPRPARAKRSKPLALR